MWRQFLKMSSFRQRHFHAQLGLLLLQKQHTPITLKFDHGMQSMSAATLATARQLTATCYLIFQLKDFLAKQQRYLLFLLELNFLLLTPCSALTCMTCIGTGQHDTTELDYFRVVARLRKPSCHMETIRCGSGQDVCVTITMQIAGSHYWIGAGCDRHEHFQHVTCENVHALTRSIQLGMVYERRTMQRVCVCSFDRCNCAKTISACLFAISIALFTVCSFNYLFTA